MTSLKRRAARWVMEGGVLVVRNSVFPFVRRGRGEQMTAISRVSLFIVSPFGSERSKNRFRRCWRYGS